VPRRPDLRSICLIGSGPIVIGQACEFDYAGSQALKVLRAEGLRTIVVNSNPATIMTDPGFADRTYLEPLDLDGVADVLGREQPDALLPTLGGQTALNLALALDDAGILETLGIELIGAGRDVIRRAEDRELFRETVRRTGLRVPQSTIVTSPRDVPADLSFPAILRPAFTLGGHGGGTARSRGELGELLDRALAESPVGQVLLAGGQLHPFGVHPQGCGRQLGARPAGLEDLLGRAVGAGGRQCRRRRWVGAVEHQAGQRHLF